jgi:hypothetical protein
VFPVRYELNLYMLCRRKQVYGLVVRVPGYRSRGLGSIPCATRFSEKQWVWNGIHSASRVQLKSCLEEVCDVKVVMKSDCLCSKYEIMRISPTSQKPARIAFYFSKLVLNCARPSGSHPRIKCDLTVRTGAIPKATCSRYSSKFSVSRLSSPP